MNAPSHECPRNGCTRSVPQRMLMCRNDWFKVPKHLRDAVWDAYYGPGPGSSEHNQAIHDAIQSVNAPEAQNA